MIKQLIFFLLLLTFSPLKAQQNLGSFVDESNLWYSNGGSIGLPLIQHTHVFHYYQGDTTIGSFTYKKMYEKRVDSTFYSPGGSFQYASNHSPYYYAAFRQEGQKVYSVVNNINNNNEFLYFDFDLQLGDTVHYYSYGTSVVIVTAIDSIPFGNQYRKKFSTDIGGVLYNDIGHQFGLFRTTYMIGTETSLSLSCFHQYGLTQYVSPFTDSPCYNYNSPTYNNQGATFTCSTPTQCGASSFAINAATNGYQSYQWNITGSGGYVSNHSGQHINVTLSQPGFYNVSLSVTYNGTTETHTETSFIHVKELPSVSIASTLVCLNSTIQVSVCNTCTYTTSNDAVATFNGGDVIAISEGNFHFIVNNDGCLVNSQTISVITPGPPATPILDQIYCSGFETNYTFLPGNSPQNTWVNNNPSIGLPASGSGNILPFIASNSTSNVSIATITVTPSIYVCNSQPFSFNITVNNANVNGGNDTIICAGQPYTLNATSNGGEVYWGWGNIPNNGTIIHPNYSTSFIVSTDYMGCYDMDTVFIQVVQSPIVNAGNDTTICFGQPYTLNATSNTNTITWNNNLPNGSIVSPTLSTQFVATSGITGCQVTDTVIVTVNPLPFVDAGNDTTICVGESYILNAITNASSINWNGNLPNGSIFTPILTEQFIVTANQSGCQNFDSVIVNVNPLPFVNAGNDTTICYGESYILNAISNTTSITWNNNLPNGSIVTPTLTEQFIVTANQSGCQNSDTVIAIINPFPIVNAGNDTSICVGQTFTPYSSGDATAYQWSSGLTDGIAFIPSATTLLTLTGELDGCFATDSILVSVSNPNLSITYFNGEDSIACDGTASVLVVNGIAPYSFAWTNNTEYYTTPSIQNLCSGVYSISIVDALGCQGSSSVTINDTLIVNQTSDTLYFTDIIYQDSTIMSADTSDWIENCTFDYNLAIGANIVSYIDNGTTTTVNWLINLNNGTSIPIDVIYPISIGNSGVYEFTLQLFCSAKSDPKFIVATSQTYIDDSIIGIQSLSLNSVFLYPNPTTSTLSISGINSDFSYKISYLQGKLLKQGVNDKQIDIEGALSGHYYITIITEKEVKTLKFVKY